MRSLRYRLMKRPWAGSRKKLGYVKLMARPRHHAQDIEALEAFKKGALQPNWKKSAQASRKALRWKSG